MTMTFQEFQATGRNCDDLGKALNDAMWEDNEVPARGRVYADGFLWIEEKPIAGWLNGRPERWFLLLGREDWLTDDLESLEQKLYDFALSEGYCE